MVEGKHTDPVKNISL